MAANKSEIKETINVSKERVWHLLFNQYGDIHQHNPTMIASHYLDQASEGALNCVRHCKFSEKLFLDEKISAIEENKRITINVTKHNLPFVKDMSATYELIDLGEHKTEVRMTSYVSTSPSFMIHLMKGQMGKSLVKHLFGMKYHLETGKTVDMKNYKDTLKNYV